MARPKIGDVLELSTKKGLAYAQYTHESRLMGSLIRVFDQFYQERPADMGAVVCGRVRLSTFTHLSSAVKQGFVRIVGNEEIAPQNKPFPLFRAGEIDPATKRVQTWWLWDGEKEWQVGSLADEQRNFPIRNVWTASILIDRIEEGWRQEENDW